MKGEQAAWPHAFFTSGEQGAEPPGNELPRRDHGLNLGKGRAAGPFPKFKP